MFAVVSDGKADLVVGSRYMSGGSSAGFSDFRQRISRLTTAIAQRVLKVTVTDPMSGFFMIRRDRFEEISPNLSVHGFKVLLDVIVSSRHELRITEVPYTFRSRLHGESKLDALVALDFLGLVLAKLTNDVVSLRFVLFGLVGALGLLVHLTALYIGLNAFELTFGRAQIVAALLAIVSNFLINNRLTYRDQRLRGLGMLRGFVLFCAVSSIGFLANVGVAFAVYESDRTWWSAGAAGSLIGLVWNYAMSNVLVWRSR
jgi:dolichol-phosphate mannosyltransferase